MSLVLVGCHSLPQKTTIMYPMIAKVQTQYVYVADRRASGLVSLWGQTCPAVVPFFSTVGMIMLQALSAMCDNYSGRRDDMVS